MTSGRRPALLALLCLLLVLVGLGAEWLAHGTRLGFAAQRDLLTGLVIGGAGVLAWARVPGSRIGMLLFAAGLTWYIGTVGDPATDSGRLAQALTFLYAGVIAHALFTWPTGRVERSIDRVLVAAGYLVALFPPLWDRDLSLMLVAALLAGGLLAQHATLTRRKRHERRAPLTLGLGLCLILAAKGALSAWLRAAGVAYPSDPEAIWQLALALTAVGLTSSLVALERRRVTVTDVVVRLGAARPVASVAELADAAGLGDDATVRAALRRVDEMTARNTSLHALLSAQVVELEASRLRLLEAGDSERAALEDRLRRGAADRLKRLETDLVSMGKARERLTPEVTFRLDRALDQIGRTRVELDELAQGLDPGLLTERGLEGALRELAGRSPVPVELAIDPLAPGRPSLERTLFYVASEALANVAKHAQAAHAWLRLGTEAEVVVLAVEDDGVGGADPRQGRGLRGLGDRLDALGGTLRVTERAGGGTRLLVDVPLSPTHPGS